MSCNPAIGGLGKGHLVREIDALGGLQALATDATGIQFRMLNTAKGPAVRAPRAQCDKVEYPRWMRKTLEHYHPGLYLLEGEVSAVLAEKGRVAAVEMSDGTRLKAHAVVVTAGTFLDGLIHVGLKSHPGGRWGDPPALKLTQSLTDLGLETQRLKTGTPARLDADTIAWDRLETQPGDVPPPPFSYMTDHIDTPQIACAITRTNPQTHDIILSALDRSPLYTGVITGTGPRYCPSIETKLVRFEGRDSHQVFLEPESRHNRSVYVNGISTSLPADAQEKFIPTIQGLEKVRILRYGYGIEYVAFPPTQLRPTLETRVVEGLYLAGQMNGTTGYEEAAGLGLLAGANAALKIKEQDPLTFRRDEAYLGVMVDDLITKGAPEPYRLFTSRAEYRLLLRQDNADLRLTPQARKAGLIEDARWERFERFRNGLEKEQAWLRQEKVRPQTLDVEALQARSIEPPREALTLERFLARPHVDYALLEGLGLSDLFARARSSANDQRIMEQAEIQAQYAGYITRQRRQIERGMSLETQALQENLAYRDIPSLRSEAAEALETARPVTLGQASRLAGVNPSDVTAILIYLATRQAKG